MDKKIYFDLTPLSVSFGGAAIYSWELCHRLMSQAEPLQVIPYTCPFNTLGKSGISRIINSILRETISHNILANLNSSDEDYFIAPTHNVPKQLYKRKYAMVILDLAAWHDSKVTTWGGKKFATALPESIKNAAQLFAISKYTAQDVAKEFNVPLESIIIAPCGLSQMYKTQANPIKKINGIQLPEQYFLHVGKFDPKKNILFLIQLYERFREIKGKAGSDVKLVLTGGQSNVNAHIPILQKIRNSPYASDIIVLGKVKSEDLPCLYRSALAFIFPSTFEGFGIPVIEALSQGTPVLVNANTSLTQFGEFGATVFDNFEVNLWANELKEISDNGKRSDSSYISKVVNYFDWDRTAQIVGKAIGLINS